MDPHVGARLLRFENRQHPGHTLEMRDGPGRAPDGRFPPLGGWFLPGVKGARMEALLVQEGPLEPGASQLVTEGDAPVDGWVLSWIEDSGLGW